MWIDKRSSGSAFKILLVRMVTSLNQLCKGVGRTDSPESWGFREQATFSLLFKSGSNEVP